MTRGRMKPHGFSMSLIVTAMKKIIISSTNEFSRKPEAPHRGRSLFGDLTRVATEQMARIGGCA